jgi:hypothetical protein
MQLPAEANATVRETTTLLPAMWMAMDMMKLLRGLAQ